MFRPQARQSKAEVYWLVSCSLWLALRQGYGAKIEGADGVQGAAREDTTTGFEHLATLRAPTTMGVIQRYTAPRFSSYAKVDPHNRIHV